VVEDHAPNSHNIAKWFSYNPSQLTLTGSVYTDDSHIDQIVELLIIRQDCGARYRGLSQQALNDSGSIH